MTRRLALIAALAVGLLQAGGCAFSLFTRDVIEDDARLTELEHRMDRLEQALRK